MKDNTQKKNKANDLINESSPYLLQHAYNPVEWKAWSDETLELAQRENKLILVSIGYSACHWCHVMERECFENDSLARIMNDHFICIKVDREERPDIDQVYMLAVQLMTGRGGWPLNCFALPDGKPVYGGTYFPAQQWQNVLLNLADLWIHEKDKIFDYADKLIQGMQISEIAMPQDEEVGSIKDLGDSIKQWIKRSDHKNGGPDRAPKFPLPVNYNFLLHYNHYINDKETEDHIRLTLDKMAGGGIYDQAGGGFARYSTDSMWKVPHFEKMLYDNAQLISLYAKAALVYKDEYYLEIVNQSCEFIRREFTGKEGQFYSALDADSEHEEGKFYVWKKEELKEILGTDYDFFAQEYDLEMGEWEHGNIILMKKERSDPETFEKLNHLNRKLLEHRESRVRPALDDKALTSWNAMMITAYLDAYIATGKTEYIDAAKRNECFIKANLRKEGDLLHTYRNGKSSVTAFLEDYAFLIQALIRLYQSTFNEDYLKDAHQLASKVMEEFYDESSGIFYFTAKSHSNLVVRKPEVNDNVIPSSSAVMAHNLFLLGHYYENENYIGLARKLALTFKPYVIDYPEGYAYWGELLLNFMQPSYEVAIAGKDSLGTAFELSRQTYPTKILMEVKKESNLPLTKGKSLSSDPAIYICSGKVCQAPVPDVTQALTLLV